MEGLGLDHEVLAELHLVVYVLVDLHEYGSLDDIQLAVRHVDLVYLLLVLDELVDALHLGDDLLPLGVVDGLLVIGLLAELVQLLHLLALVLHVVGDGVYLLGELLQDLRNVLLQLKLLHLVLDLNELLIPLPLHLLEHLQQLA